MAEVGDTYPSERVADAFGSQSEATWGIWSGAGGGVAIDCKLDATYAIQSYRFT